MSYNLKWFNHKPNSTSETVTVEYNLIIDCFVVTFVTVNCLNICQIIYLPFYGGDIERFAVPTFRIKLLCQKWKKFSMKCVGKLCMRRSSRLSWLQVPFKHGNNVESFSVCVVYMRRGKKFAKIFSLPQSTCIHRLHMVACRTNCSYFT